MCRAGNCLEVWESKPAGTLKTIPVIALPLHILPAVCRSKQFIPSTNSAVSQRCYRPASCTVDVDWLKVWVQLVVRGEVNRRLMYSKIYIATEFVW